MANRIMLVCALVIWTFSNSLAQTELSISQRYPQYWALNGQPTMLLGGTVEDNLFQITGLENHLDLLASVGGNYVRNTMSSRDEGNQWPFYLDQGQVYMIWIVGTTPIGYCLKSSYWRLLAGVL